MDIKPIKTERDYRRTLSRIEALMDARPGSVAEDELDILSTIVEVYEEKRFAIPDAHPLEVIRFVMEQNDMQDKDLIPFIGSSGRVSEVMSGRRPLTINMIRKLQRGLKIPADALIREYDVA
jgi:HTH-type transcriptional regulator / antitoxin HigA